MLSVGDAFAKLDKYDVESWSDIVAIFTSKACTIGLKSDGTVVSAVASTNYYGQCDVTGWTDICVYKN